MVLLVTQKTIIGAFDVNISFFITVDTLLCCPKITFPARFIDQKMIYFPWPPLSVSLHNYLKEEFQG
jgi:hypothetical protein